ncbi:MFS transporter [Desulfuromonas thiophila]|uniref:MFS transporter n=1 Tax=Desulfuromonas thiophila TaxID=57664 RepID=UPI0029F5821C|nr:MFS transporter [Desulfuromonas thiophila]
MMYSLRRSSGGPPCHRRRSFSAMAICYFLGAGNDNLFKQAALLVAVSQGLTQLQGWATLLFALPFLLFSAAGGWLADRYDKQRVILAVKILELLLVGVGGLGLLWQDWRLILAMVFALALQSALFGPALNGAVPELYPARQLVRANARLKLVSTLAILLGIALAGVLLDAGGGPLVREGRRLVALTAAGFSGLGICAALVIAPFGARRTPRPFPWLGPWRSLQDLWQLRHDPLLALALAGSAFFYFLASLVVLQLNSLGVQQLGLSARHTSLLSVALMLGICAGAFLAARLTSVTRWRFVLVPALLGLTLGLALVGSAALLAPDWQQWLLLPALVMSGACGGLFLIPQASFLQARPAADARGQVIAAANFCAFGGILFSGQLFNGLALVMTPGQGLQCSALLTLLAAGGLAGLLRRLAD